MATDEWWNDVFVDHGELYAEVLEAHREEAAPEAEFVASQLREHGIEPGSLVLDLACGVGRHAVELAERGYRVTGVDLSPALVEHAERSAAKSEADDRLNFVEGDMRELGKLFADGQFDAVINLFTSFGFFDEETDGGILEECGRITADGAVFVIDTVNRDWIMRNFQPSGVRVEGEILTIERRDFDLEQSHSVSRWTMLRPGEGETLVRALDTEVEHRVFTLRELIEVFDEHGWAYCEAFGDLDGSDFGVASPRIVGVFEHR